MSIRGRACLTWCKSSSHRRPSFTSVHIVSPVNQMYRQNNQWKDLVGSSSIYSIKVTVEAKKAPVVMLYETKKCRETRPTFS